ncbi:MAG: hypothetical protein WC083_05625 [Candidatus Methanomethylophilaceae archaeon]
MAEALPLPRSERPAIATLIDGAYMATARQGTNLRVYLLNPRGPLEPRFLEFYECFSALFTLTSPYQEIVDDADNRESLILLAEIRRWLDPRHRTISESRALAGLTLFERWQRVLARKDVISWQR